MNQTNNQKKFQAIYKENSWQGNSRSGPGSDFENCKRYVQTLQQFLQRHSHQIRTIVDIGCGDWSIAQHIDWTGYDYRGIDIVPELIEHLQQNYATDHIQFTCLDLTEQELPAADLLIVKDVLQHLSNEAVSNFIQQLNRYSFALLVNDCNRFHQSLYPLPYPKRAISKVNSDIENGEWRPLQLQTAPFCLAAQEILMFEYKLTRRTIDQKEVLLWRRDAG